MDKKKKKKGIKPGQVGSCSQSASYIFNRDVHPNRGLPVVH